MSITKVSKFVLEDGSVSLAKLDTAAGSLGQTLTIGPDNSLQFADSLAVETVEDIVAGLIIRGTHTNMSVSYADSTNSLSFIASGAVTSVNSLTGVISLNTDNIAEGTNNLYWTDNRFNTLFNAKTTDNISEGTNNLYYTDARTDARAQLKVDALVSSSPEALDTLRELASALGDDANFSTTVTTSLASKFNTSDFNATAETWFNKTTDDINEGTSNLYHTTARTRSAISASGDIVYSPLTGVISFSQSASAVTSVNAQSGAVVLDTDDVSEGNTNLYYTDARATDSARNAISVSGDLTYNSTTGVISTQGLNSSTTDALNEGTNNLYYTDARADARAQLKVDALVSSAPSALDTLNELASALGDDANFSTTVTNNLATKLNASDFNSTADTWLTSNSTDDLSEGTSNLYYTDARTDARAQLKIDALESNLETNGGQDVHFGNISNLPIVTKDILTGDGTTSTFSLSATPGNEDAAIVTINGVTQMPGSDYSVSGSNITFTTTPPSGQVILVRQVGYQIIGSSLPTALPKTGGTMTGSILVAADNQYDLGSGANQWRTIYAREVEATYADLAERYETDSVYEVGTVVVFGGEAEITQSTSSTDVSVAGIISGQPALKMNSAAGNDQTHPYVALKGRVPCKVIGTVSKGDLLVSSDVPGYAKSVGKVDYGQAVLAKSLENSSDDGKKMIEVVVV